jgi:micrococcal nuclease
MADAPIEVREIASGIDAYVHYCSDGDTCRVRIGDSLWLNVRLAGIDAPEVARGKKKPGQPLGDEAKSFLNAQVKGQKVRLRQTDLDHFNRPVVEVTKGLQSVNLALIREGFAEAYRGPAKRLDRTPYLKAEDEAKAARRGIWSLKNYLPPARFRAMTK